MHSFHLFIGIINFYISSIHKPSDSDCTAQFDVPFMWYRHYKRVALTTERTKEGQDTKGAHPCTWGPLGILCSLQAKLLTFRISWQFEMHPRGLLIFHPLCRNTTSYVHQGRFEVHTDISRCPRESHKNWETKIQLACSHNRLQDSRGWKLPYVSWKKHLKTEAVAELWRQKVY